MALRREPKAEAQPTVPAQAIVIETLRVIMGPTFERGMRLPLDHWAVKAYPSHFRGVVPLPTEEVS